MSQGVPYDFDPLGIEPNAESDFVRGYLAASIAVLGVEQQIKNEWPNESKAFYRGVLDGIRQEL